MIYLTRVNLDVTESDFEKSLRFLVAAEELKKFSKQSNKVVVLSHRGRPEGYEEKLSFRKFTPALSKSIGRQVIFCPSFDFRKLQKDIRNAKNGSVFLLENLRFLSGERKNSRRLARSLASLGDVFVNNDFATSHRKSASLVAITKYIPSEWGSVLKKEVNALSRARESTHSPFILIIGGAKTKDKISTMQNLLSRADAVLLGGRAANVFAKARGVDIKESPVDPAVLKMVKKLAKNDKVITPLDFAEEKKMFLDIGPETTREYARVIKSARTIIWGGPMGVFEKKKFRAGNDAVARAIFRNKKAHTVIGGIETVYALPMDVRRQEYGNIFISTGGGAMLHFFTGEKLPGVEALRKSKK